MQAAAPRIHQAKKNAQIFFRLGVVVDHFIQGKRQDLKRMQMHDQGTQRGLQIAHDQRRRHALALDVCYDQQQSLWSQIEEIVVVASHFETGLVENREFVSGDNRRRLRQQAPLDVARQCHLFFQPLLLDDFAMQPRLFQRHGHVAGKFLQKINVFAGEFAAAALVQQLDNAHDLSVEMADGQAEQ